MRNLIEIANIVRGIRVKSTDLLTVNKRKKTNPHLFYDKILEGAFRSDLEAAQFFFKTDTNSSSYKNLKRSLRQKLLNTIFFIEPSTAQSDYERAYLYCCKNMFAAKILVFLHAHNSGSDLCKRVFAKATEFELTEFIIESSRYLRLHMGTRFGNREKFEEFNELYRTYTKVRAAEHLAEEYYIRLILPKVHRKSTDDDTQSQAEEFYRELRPLMEQYGSPFLHFIGRYLQVIALMSVNNYEETIEVCEQAIQFFDSKPYSYKTPLRVFLHNQLVCYTQLKEYEKGKKVVEKSNLMVRAGTYSWFQNNELNLILALHSCNYQESIVILEHSINHRKFKSMPLVVREQWLIYEAYVYFLVTIGKIQIPDDRKRRFKLGKFLNSIPTYSKDKRGLNIPILIIQILLMIVKKDYERSIDRIDAIEKYCSRYLTDKSNLRSNCFIKMLLQIPISGFHKAGVERRTNKYFQRLLGTPLNISQQPHEVEIIPYEDLWEFVMESLETKYYRQRGSASRIA
ncbi:MAG: hypothetical protein AAFV95_17330 [Bacteroidota bacterium]